MHDRFFRRSIWHVGAVVFAVSLILRLIMDLVFYIHFGFRAANHLEAWFYAAVMEGVKLPAGGLMDPTVWLLRAVGAITPNGYSFYAVVVASAVLSSSAAFLLCLLISELYERKVGFVAGMVYGGMVEPIGLSIVGFTHDHLQIPLMLLSMLLAVKAVKEGGKRRIMWAAAYGLVAYNSMHINGNIWVIMASTAAYVGYNISERMLCKKGINKTSTSYSTYIALVVLAMLVLGRTVLVKEIENTLEALPQGRSGSVDVIPLTLLVIWLRDNILLFLIPFGLLAAYRRRDTLAVTLALSGFAVATIMSRGTRISDIGVASIVAFAVVDWDMKEIKGIFSKKNRLKATLAFSILVYLFMALYTDTRPGYLLVFFAGGVGLMYSLWRFSADARILSVSSVFVLVGAFFSVVFIYTVDARDIAPQLEYDFLTWLRGNNGGGRMLIAWDHGYLAEFVSGLGSVSTPNAVDERVHNLLWMPERQAAVGLWRAGVRYVFITSGDFEVAEDASGRRMYGYKGLMFPPKIAPPLSLANRITAVRLLDDGTLGYFRLLRRGVDEATGLGLFLYEVNVQPSDEEKTGALVGGILANPGSGKAVLVNVSIASGGMADSRIFKESFGDKEVREVLYGLGPFGGDYNCTMTVTPIGAGSTSPGEGNIRPLIVFC